MGWAPNSFFTGPIQWFTFLGQILFWSDCIVATGFLLDNAPLNLGLLTFGQYLAFTSLGKFGNFGILFPLAGNNVILKPRLGPNSELHTQQELSGWPCFAAGSS